MPNDNVRYVIYHPTDGVYLGNCLGLGFFANLDPVGQPEAVTFKSEQEALEHLRSWDPNPESTFRSDLLVKPVDTGGAQYASIEQIVAAGLPAWDPDATPQEEAEPASILDWEKVDPDVRCESTTAR
jgi:hypothetical protein